MKVVPVKAREDNYMYLLIDKENKAAAVDPYDVPKIQEKAQQLGVQVIAALTTHHHYDHSGGNKEFAKAYPDAPIYGGSDSVPALTKLVRDRDEFKVGQVNVRCLATPCHTLDSICYHVTSDSHPGGVFTGDTLFIAGCGRFFEGSPVQMNQALSYLGTLPNETVVYNGHEYTRASAAFGRHVDPENAGLKRLQKLIEEKEDGVITGLTTIGDEKEWNVFMRLSTEAVRKATGADEKTPEEDVIAKLREMKNNYRG